MNIDALKHIDLSERAALLLRIIAIDEGEAEAEILERLIEAYWDAHKRGTDQ